MPTDDEMKRQVRRHREQIAAHLESLLAAAVLTPAMTVGEAIEVLRNAPVS